MVTSRLLGFFRCFIAGSAVDVVFSFFGNVAVAGTNLVTSRLLGFFAFVAVAGTDVVTSRLLGFFRFVMAGNVVAKRWRRYGVWLAAFDEAPVVEVAVIKEELVSCCDVSASLKECDSTLVNYRDVWWGSQTSLPVLNFTADAPGVRDQTKFSVWNHQAVLVVSEFGLQQLCRCDNFAVADK